MSIVSENPQQAVVEIEGLLFFSNFDSGNMSKAYKVGPGQYEVHVSPDAASIGYNKYRTWFHFGVSGLKRGSLIRISLSNLTLMKVFANPLYRPVYRVLPNQPEWKRVESETLYEPTYTIYYKYSWTFEVISNDSIYYFAYAPAYPYLEIQKTISEFQQKCPQEAIVFRETLCKSIDGRDIELLTFSNKSNFTDSPESAFTDIFGGRQRCPASNKPIIFISSRVHPGETPASFVLDGIFQLILSNDPRGTALRSNFVFKIVPVLNPDGVFRGNFRVDQNGFNLNRFYITADSMMQPSIYAVRKYFEYISPMVRYYFDLHAHASKRSCFLFGNALEFEKQVDNQVFAKLIEVNSGYFEYSGCDFSEKSMSYKDPKDHHSKEGSGRVALYKSSGITHCYTIECSYYMPRQVHIVPPELLIKSTKRLSELSLSDNIGVPVYNKGMFNDIGHALLFSILDYEKINPASRVPLSEFRFLEAAKDWIRGRLLAQARRSSKKIPAIKSDSKPLRKHTKPLGLPTITSRRFDKSAPPYSQESLSAISKSKPPYTFYRVYPSLGSCQGPQ